MAGNGAYEKRGNKLSKTVRLQDSVTGKSYVKRISASTKRELDALIVEAKFKASRGGGVAPSKLTVAQLFEMWFEHAEGRVTPSTLFTRRGIYRNRIEPELGGIRLDRLTALAVERCLTDEHRRGHKPSTIAQTHTLLRLVLNAAVQWGLVETNVATKVRPPSQIETERTTWDEEDLRAFLDANDGCPHLWLFRVAIETGMRRGELLALRWANVDLDRGVIQVRETLSRDEKGGWITGTRPKTRSGHRDILIAASTVEGLRRLRAAQLRRRLALGQGWHDTDLVFDRGDGKRLDPEALRTAFRKAIDRAGVPPIRFHDLRHSCATLMMANNVHQTIGQARLGHKDAKTMRRYLHPALEMQRPVVALFEERVYRPRPEQDREEAV